MDTKWVDRAVCLRDAPAPLAAPHSVSSLPLLCGKGDVQRKRWKYSKARTSPHLRAKPIINPDRPRVVTKGRMSTPDVPRIVVMRVTQNRNAIKPQTAR
jgi:hypothetical protein